VLSPEGWEKGKEPHNNRETKTIKTETAKSEAKGVPLLILTLLTKTDRAQPLRALKKHD